MKKTPKQSQFSRHFLPRLPTVDPFVMAISIRMQLMLPSFPYKFDLFQNRRVTVMAKYIIIFLPSDNKENIMAIVAKIQFCSGVNTCFIFWIRISIAR